MVIWYTPSVTNPTFDGWFDCLRCCCNSCGHSAHTDGNYYGVQIWYLAQKLHCNCSLLNIQIKFSKNQNDLVFRWYLYIIVILLITELSLLEVDTNYLTCHNVVIIGRRNVWDASFLRNFIASFYSAKM